MAVSWGLESESRVMASAKSLENFRISSLLTCSPVLRTCGRGMGLLKEIQKISLLPGLKNSYHD